jgi:hypothetical protein
MTKAATKPTSKKSVETLKHNEAKRKNIPTAEYQSVLEKEQQHPKIIFIGPEFGTVLRADLVAAAREAGTFRRMALGPLQHRIRRGDSSTGQGTSARMTASCA